MAIESAFDISLTLVSLMMAYILTLAAAPRPEELTIDSPKILISLFSVALCQVLFYMILGMYGTSPLSRRGSAGSRIVVINIFFYTIVLFSAIKIYDADNINFVFIWGILGALITTAILLLKEKMVVSIVSFIRKRRYNLRRVLIVGDNTATVVDFVKQVSKNTGYGIMILGYVGDRIHPVVGCEKLGGFGDLARILDEQKPTDVVFAIDAYDKRRLIKLVNLCDDRCVKVYFLPVIYGFFKNAAQIEPIGSLPVINIHSTPLDDRINRFIKRVIDIFGSLILILMTSPVMLFAAIGVYISSPGPILFKQERVGKLGKKFTMLKFRSMHVNSDSDVGWSTETDDRKTRFGTFLRKTSIDELPQLFNVLFGSMSLVGPRPEVPHFVEHFREVIPLYMVKHYVKPGLTGLAQIKGLRGDTPVEERIHEDIEYIENWSVGLDIAIILKTPFKMFNRAEKYVESDKGAREDKNGSTDMVAEELTSVGGLKLTVDEGDIPADSVASDEYVGKILYAASTMSHINNFHLPYINKLREDGYKVLVMARGDGADFNIPFEKKLFSSSNKACRAKIKKIIAEEKFDSIILNTSLAAFHIRLCLPKTNRPRVINIVHGYLFSYDSSRLKKRLLLTCERYVAGRTDTIITMNEDDKNIATANNLATRVKLSRGMGATVKPMVTPPYEIRRREHCEDKFVMTFVGELSARKNQRFLILALNEVKERIPDAVLWLVGTGLAEESLRSLASEVDVSDSVHFLGHRDDVCDVMRATDLYVSASSIEGMPFNIIEALGSGCTVLSSDIKGHKDIIDDGVTGYLFKHGSVRDFVDKAAMIHDHGLVLDKEEIMKTYRRFSSETVFDETYSLIKESLADEK